MSARPRIVVAGAGFAGLEAAYLMRMRMRDDVDITVVAPNDRFVFRPNTIYLPFGGDVDPLLVDLAAPFRRRDITHHRALVTEVDPVASTVATDDGQTHRYDALVLATGAAMRPDEIPGLAEHACTIWTIDEMMELRTRLDALVARARDGERQRVLLTVAPNNKCAGPRYEIAFMLETWLRRQGVRDKVDIMYRTYEAGFIQAFGPRLHDVVVEEFAERGIDGRTGASLVEVREGESLFADGSREAHDLVVAFPPYVAQVRYEGLASDERGFVATRLETRQAVDHPAVYVPGDAGDFPVKQAFLAFLQADAVADHVASAVKGNRFATPFDPVSMCVMEMFDKATFAQVPLRLTGDPARPVEVRPDAGDGYRVGVSPLWRFGKKLLGMYLPMRFHAGEPFHAGAGWQMMEVGLKGMSAVLSH
ncbi:MAG: FAD-dependent oxidoreductase [Actinomycetota bacterium]